MSDLELTTSESGSVLAFLSKLTRGSRSPGDPSFLSDAPFLAQSLPVRLRKEILDLRHEVPTKGFRVVSGFPVDQSHIGDTPGHWDYPENQSRTRTEDFFHVLCASLLGEVFGFTTLQKGKIVNDILPIKGHEWEQLSSGSLQPFSWHTEDAYHEYRSDYLSLMCLRNPDRAATTLSSIDSITLDRADLDQLFEPSFVIYPDDSYLKGTPIGGEGNRSSVGSDGPKHVVNPSDRPRPVAVLFGSKNDPYIRLDSYLMERNIPGPALRALEHLEAAIDSVAQEIALTPGDVLLIDNFKAVHGRRSYRPRFDGKDRWLKRILVTSDLRKSRANQVSGTRLIS